VPFLEEALEGYSFNWDKILFDNIAKEVSDYRATRARGQPMTFYMSAYIMDVICFMNPFPLMNWSWNTACLEPIHEYHSELWEENAKNSFYEICHFVVIPMHKMFFSCDPPRIYEVVSNNLKPIADWFIEESFSYIRVYGCSIPAHALPKFLLDRLVCREVAHQIVKGGIVRKTGPQSNKIKQMQKQNTEDTQYKKDTDLRGSPSVGYVHQRNC
jgi:hypothetical protein